MSAKEYTIRSWIKLWADQLVPNCVSGVLLPRLRPDLPTLPLTAIGTSTRQTLETIFATGTTESPAKKFCCLYNLAPHDGFWICSLNNFAIRRACNPWKAWRFVINVDKKTTPLKITSSHMQGNWELLKHRIISSERTSQRNAECCLHTRLSLRLQHEIVKLQARILHLFTCTFSFTAILRKPAHWHVSRSFEVKTFVCRISNFWPNGCAVSENHRCYWLEALR